jgi:hypothetical protein
MLRVRLTADVEGGFIGAAGISAQVGFCYT